MCKKATYYSALFLNINMKKEEQEGVDPLHPTEAEDILTDGKEKLIDWKAAHEARAAKMRDAFKQKAQAKRTTNKANRKYRSGRKHGAANKLLDAGVVEETAYVIAEVKISDPTEDDSLPPDTYTINNVDTWGEDIEKSDAYYMQVALATGQWLYQRTLGYLNSSKKKKMSAKNGHVAILSYLKKRHRRFEFIDDEWALSNIRYAFVSNGLYANGKKNRYIDKAELIKRGKNLIFYKKITPFEIDYENGTVTIPRIDGYGTFDIQLAGPIEKRYDVSLIKITKDMVSTHGLTLSIYHDDPRPPVSEYVARAKYEDFKVCNELEQLFNNR